MTDYISDLSSDILSQIIDHMDPPTIVAMYQVSNIWMKILNEKYNQIMKVCNNHKNKKKKFEMACDFEYIYIAKWIYSCYPRLMNRRGNRELINSNLLKSLAQKDKNSTLKMAS